MILPVPTIDVEDTLGIRCQGGSIPASQAVSIGIVELVAEVADRQTITAGEVSSITAKSADEIAGAVLLIEEV
jgi:hypothetical protein